MSEIQHRAASLNRFPEQGDVFTYSETPSAKPSVTYRLKGTNRQIHQLPPGGINNPNIEVVVDGKVLVSDLEIKRLRERVRHHYHLKNQELHPSGQKSAVELEAMVESEMNRILQGVQ